MTEKTLVLIKPDAVERNLIGRILVEYERNDLKVLDMKLMKASIDLAEKHYAEHNGKPFFNRLVTYLTRSPIVALVLEGENAISRVRALNGTTDPETSKDNTIRALYGLSLSENTVHASDSKESAGRERSIWFAKNYS
ncbi:nucleoside-diphosphate kinase [Carnobacterium viridans]|uniref:Nucleoside diphosphate kinase n=1 Tax=Carnobacterium viridans TaxID=174587 RepID=A0A1H0YYU5_9LACT|nr:nucleoside-diphosphate kinase [Carnobacterium viridans]UDE94876.1 nucleoside-diphosphate kinase [Carnobacterium viridans]SDQ20362.1 nucleoside diphosphate kinase [Carnobacterium viridans]